ncbi:succinate dehydrogenase assembly factor 2 [Rhodobacteraceae bacterium NNCM2]|nr:succinate dehydrogenase assembly factor 2 [Coraliihabitans acroporae]
MTDPTEIRLKRLRIRAWRRGTKEMDLILGGYVDSEGASLDEATIAALEAVMEENDNDLYQWVSGQSAGPERHEGILSKLREFHRIS